jgi:hypothetical protein
LGIVPPPRRRHDLSTPRPRLSFFLEAAQGAIPVKQTEKKRQTLTAGTVG